MHHDVIENTVDAFFVVQFLGDSPFHSASSGADERCENGPAECAFKRGIQVIHDTPSGVGYWWVWLTPTAKLKVNQGRRC